MSRSTDIYAVPRTTPQTEKARDDQILNAAGGYTFATTDEERLLRFLILGTTEGTFYVSAQRSSHVDAFITITDNETWAGNEHPYEVLALYRRKVNPNAKALSLAMTATQNTICDPTDPLSLNIVGLDANVATAVDQFIRL